ncbi:MAG: hypothetical protein B1H09_07060, partial [Gemmatimonadaceae bacterium 4484_173]
MKESVVDSLATALGKLPGIGKKTALRLAFALVDNRQLASDLSTVLAETAAGVRECVLCRNLTDGEVCETCLDRSRQNTICVVHTPADRGEGQEAQRHEEQDVAEDVGAAEVSPLGIVQWIQPGVVQQDPFAEGYQGVVYALKILKGEEVPEEVIIPVTIVTQE